MLTAVIILTLAAVVVARTLHRKDPDMPTELTLQKLAANLSTDPRVRHIGQSPDGNPVLNLDDGVQVVLWDLDRGGVSYDLRVPGQDAVHGTVELNDRESLDALMNGGGQL